MGDNYLGHDERTEDGVDDFIRGGATTDVDVFEELQDEVDEMSAEGLVDDPGYQDFLNSFGELEMKEDKMSLDELLRVGEDGEDSDEEGPQNDDNGPSQNQRIDVSDGNETRDVPISVDALIEALEHERVSDAKRAELREALGLRDRRQMEVQLNYLKSRFLDLEAYLQAMEDLFEADTDLLEEVEELHANVAALRDELEAQDERIARLEAELDELDDDTDRRERKLKTVDRRLDETRNMLDRNLSAIETELSEARQWREDVAKAFRMADTDSA